MNSASNERAYNEILLLNYVFLFPVVSFPCLCCCLFLISLTPKKQFYAQVLIAKVHFLSFNCKVISKVDSEVLISKFQNFNSKEIAFKTVMKLSSYKLTHFLPFLTITVWVPTSLMVVPWIGWTPRVRRFPCGKRWQIGLTHGSMERSSCAHT